MKALRHHIQLAFSRNPIAPTTPLARGAGGESLNASAIA